MPLYIELAWARDKNHLTFIDPDIADLVGWTAEEIMEMACPHDILAPSHAHTTQALLIGEPNTIQAHTADLVLRHKDGHDVATQTTMICRYGPDGNLAEMWGATHPVCSHYSQLEAWWKQMCPIGHVAVCDTLTLYPAT